MFQPAKKTLLLTVAIAALALGAGSIAFGDDTPPANPAPGGRHNDPAWAACKKQADDQKMERGDARRAFMKNCMKSSKNPEAPPAKS